MIDPTATVAKYIYIHFFLFWKSGLTPEGGVLLKEARSPYFAYLQIDASVTCQLFFGYHSKANSKTYPLIP